MYQLFKGAGVALITPFLADNKVDFAGLGNLVDAQIKGGIDFLVVLGTTAETSTLSFEEKQQVIDYVTTRVSGKIPTMVGIGGNSTSEVIETIHRFDLSTSDGILSVVPYYNKPTQEGLYQHFKSIAESTPLPIMLYNVPGRTSIHMSALTTIRLANDLKNIVGIKEASGNFSEIIKILNHKPATFALLTGDDSLIVPTTSLGGEGVISVAANLAPKGIADMTHFAMSGDFTKAAALQLQFQPFIDDLFAEGNPAGIKAAMHSLGLIENKVRLPLVPVSEPLYRELANKAKNLC